MWKCRVSVWKCRSVVQRIGSQPAVQCQCPTSLRSHHDGLSFWLGFGSVGDWRSSRRCLTASTLGTWSHCFEHHCTRASPDSAPSCTGLVRRRTWNESCCFALCVRSRPQFQWERDRQCPVNVNQTKENCVTAFGCQLVVKRKVTHQNWPRIGDYRFEKLFQSVHWEKVAETGEELIVVSVVISAGHVPLVAWFAIGRRCHD